ncbi:hypothetical protein [Pontibacter sp. G13]|uniref:hypothetical protein n=1 Tax=Pontibacter sp. G13 TaxID=3074898 RepID=UPI002889BA09|nr:hypothetical protein [Pontibacter sp. G13]WNJ18863.1 hypothetical protein RJD25_00070 [Pontibacter sp. G13]
MSTHVYSKWWLLGLLALCLALCTACDPVLFSHPQPEGFSWENQFPKAWQGEYQLSDSLGLDIDTLVISPTEITLIGWESRAIQANEDSQPLVYEFDKQRVRIWEEGAWSAPLRYTEESSGGIRVWKRNTETVGLSDTARLTLAGSYGFLNLQAKYDRSSQPEQKLWEVFCFSFQSPRTGTIEFLSDEHLDQIEAFGTLEEARYPEGGRSHYLATMQASSFLSMVESVGFGHQIILTRIK